MTKPPTWSRSIQFNEISSLLKWLIWDVLAERLSKLRWICITPLGIPVLPEVRSNRAKSSGWVLSARYTAVHPQM